MNILLTGCAGFIGFHTALALLERGDTIIGLDNLNEYYDPSLKEARLKILKEKPNFSFYKHDLKDWPFPIKEQIDKICHLGAQAGVRYSLESPRTYVEANDMGTLNVFEFAKENKIKDVVYASSSSVYGNVKEYPFKETMNVDTPISLYAQTKRSNELLAHVYHHLFNINMTGLRFFTVYGPWGRPDMALFTFTKNMLEGKPIDVYNNGEMKRDFTYIADIVQGVVAALDKPFPYEIFNLARGECVPLMDFIQAIEKAMGKEAQKNMMPLQPGDVPITSGDITHAKELLNYQPETSVEEGVKRFVEWYKKHYS